MSFSSGFFCSVFILPASKGTSQLAFSWPCQGPRLRFTAPVSDAHMQFAPQGFETCFRLIGARDAIVVLDVATLYDERSCFGRDCEGAEEGQWRSMACLSSLVDGRSAVEHGLWHSVALSERDAIVARGGGWRIVTLVRRIDLRQALAVGRVRHQSTSIAYISLFAMQSKFSGTSNSEYQPCNNRGIIHYPVYEDQGTTVECRRFRPSHPSGTSRRQRYRIEKPVHYGNLAALGRSQQQTPIHHPPPQPPPMASITHCRLGEGAPGNACRIGHLRIV